MKKKFEVFLDRVHECLSDMSVSGFSRILGLNQKTVDLYLKGERKPSVEFVMAICSNFDVSADWLLGLDDSSSSGVSLSASGGSVAANNSTVNTGGKGGTSAEVSRLLGIIESQQRVIESLASAKR